MDERRQSTRYDFRGEGRLILHWGESNSEVNFTSLSEHGCRVRGFMVPAPGQTCRLAFDWDGREFESEAEVKWKTHGGEAGLQFAPLNDANLNLVRRICATLHLEPSAPSPPEPPEE
jgi:PilZ domain